VTRWGRLITSPSSAASAGWRRIIAGARCVAAALIVTSCAADYDDSRPDPVAAVVSIRATGCFVASLGTGVSVDHSLVLTSAHVVAGTDEIEVTDAAGVLRSASIVHLDPVLDIALLQVPGLPERGVLVSSTKQQRGAQGTALLPAELTDGKSRGETTNHRQVPVELIRPVILETEDIYIEADVSRPAYEIRTEIIAGDSGAPVLVGREVVAIVWARSRVAEDRAWAINVSSVRQQIDDPSTRQLPEPRCP
jgi:hypothetical protein